MTSILEVARDVLLVTAEVEQAVAAEVEQYVLGLAGLFALQSLIDRALDRVSGLRCDDHALGARKQHRRLEDRQLRV